jgi:hypothetical protein
MRCDQECYDTGRLAYLYHNTRGPTRIRLASKNFARQFSFPLQKKDMRIGRNCALDCANNPLKFIQMVHT